MSDRDAPTDDADEVSLSLERLALDGGHDVLQLELGSPMASPALHLATEHGRNVTVLGGDKVALEAVTATGIPALDADIDTEDWPSILAGRNFDVVILAGVIDLVREPEQLLETVLSAGVLRPDGALVLSVSNATRAEAITRLIHGDVLEAGLNRFSLARLHRLLDRAGFLVERVDRIAGDASHGPDIPASSLPAGLLETMRELNVESDVRAYVVRAVVNTAANQLARQREQFESERRTWAGERAVLERGNAALRRDLDRVSALLREERAAFAGELEAGVAELDARDARIRRLRERRDKLVRERDRARRIVAASMYQESRGVRAAARLVRKLRALRRPRG